MGPSDADENGDPLDVVFEADEDSRTAARDRESLSALESLHELFSVPTQPRRSTKDITKLKRTAKKTALVSAKRILYN
ncbi:hypothetical protein HDU98_004512, partial [Podochytrium sp. JEL0797]